ncbi:MAG: hypothetical protein FK734_01940 [Asgard group archaeon]|nr:hypothetical protein [Asgard group archaeon]
MPEGTEKLTEEEKASMEFLKELLKKEGIKLEEYEKTIKISNDNIKKLELQFGKLETFIEKQLETEELEEHEK